MSISASSVVWCSAAQTDADPAFNRHLGDTIGDYARADAEQTGQAIDAACDAAALWPARYRSSVDGRSSALNRRSRLTDITKPQILGFAWLNFLSLKQNNTNELKRTSVAA